MYFLARIIYGPAFSFFINLQKHYIRERHDALSRYHNNIGEENNNIGTLVARSLSWPPWPPLLPREAGPSYVFYGGPWMVTRVIELL